MATIRQWLTEQGFDFGNGTILFQPAASSPGWTSVEETGKGRMIRTTHPILDHVFDDGFGAPECPRFIAEDSEAIYFPAQYDGATWCEKVHKDITYYVDHVTPYPGGG